MKNESLKAKPYSLGVPAKVSTVTGSPPPALPPVPPFQRCRPCTAPPLPPVAPPVPPVRCRSAHMPRRASHDGVAAGAARRTTRWSEPVLPGLASARDRRRRCFVQRAARRERGQDE